VVGEDAFWAKKRAAWRKRRRLRRARKKFLEAKFENPNSMPDIDENSLEWDELWRISEESSTLGSSSDE
jgi:hypothetical protein